MAKRKTHKELELEGKISGLSKAMNIVGTTSAGMSAYDALTEAKERIYAHLNATQKELSELKAER